MLARDVQELEQVVVPAPVWMLNSIVREALLTSVTWSRAARELPDQPGIHGAERESTRFGALAGARHVVQDPGDLAAGKIGVDHQAGPLRDQRLVTRRFEPVAEFRGAAILPDDRVADRLPGIAVPDDVVSRWLVMPIAAMSRGAQLRAAERFDRDRDLRGPDLLRIVFDPAGLRKDLRGIPSGRPPRRRRRGRRQWRGNWWCLDRAQEGMACMCLLGSFFHETG